MNNHKQHPPAQEQAAKQTNLIIVPNKQYLTQKQVSNLYNLPESSLEKWRNRKVGPPYHKLGKHIRYCQNEVDEWVGQRKVVTS